MCVTFYHIINMGKKKKGKKVTVQKRVYKIPKFFECPFCGRKDGIKISIHQKEKYATLECRSCHRGESEQIPIDPLTEPIDIYDNFMDRTREANIEFNAQPIDRDFSSDDDGNKIADSDGDFVEDDDTKIKKGGSDNSDSNSSALSSDKSDSNLSGSDKSDSE